MLLLLAGFLAGPVAGTSTPGETGACTWVHGRFNLWNGSSVRRIWIVGTHRLLALRDADEDVPDEVRKYLSSGPYLRKSDGLYGDFHVCALEPGRAGRMQHVRLAEAWNLRFRGRPFRPNG